MTNLMNQHHVVQGFTDILPDREDQNSRLHIEGSCRCPERPTDNDVFFCQNSGKVVGEAETHV